MENQKINVDLLTGLPASKSAWPIYLGDHYTRENLNINQVVHMLMDKLTTEMAESTDPAETYLEFDEVWNRFVEGSNFGDPSLFENTVFRAVPELERLVREKRI